MKVRTYSDLIKLPTFKERFDYLKVSAPIGSDTFGPERYINQAFYSSVEWRKVSRQVILRDNACDLGVPGFDIVRVKGDKSKDCVIIVHHMNPITIEQIINRDPDILNPEYLITTKMLTHNLLHFGAEGHFPPHKVTERMPGDTKLW